MNLSVIVMQLDTIWRSPIKNLLSIEQQITGISDNTDILVLPEVFTSGFTTQADCGLTEDGELIQVDRWLMTQARHFHVAIVGSVICCIDGAMRNRCYFVSPTGDIHYYDKVHLFRMADEHKRYNAGNKRVIVNYKGWRLLLTVCYDLRFPVFCRNQNDYDVMICVANWPSSRRQAWRTLAQARAIENQSYVVAVNRVGQDGNGLDYSGDSMIVSPEGEVIVDCESLTGVSTGVLEKATLTDLRNDFPVWRDQDSFELDLNRRLND